MKKRIYKGVASGFKSPSKGILSSLIELEHSWEEARIPSKIIGKIIGACRFP